MLSVYVFVLKYVSYVTIRCAYIFCAEENIYLGYMYVFFSSFYVFTSEFNYFNFTVYMWRTSA